MRTAYETLLSGETVAEIEKLGNGTQRRVKYSMASLSRLKAEMEAAHAACLALYDMPNPRRRFAIEGGAKRTRFYR